MCANPGAENNPRAPDFPKSHGKEQTVMIYFTGDTHGGLDMSKLMNKNLRSTCGMPGEDDYLIILGDFGFPFFDEDRKRKRRKRRRIRRNTTPITTSGSSL